MHLSKAALTIMAMATVAQAGPIYDASFFDSIPHTLIDFETRGSGANAFPSIMPVDEYEPQGIMFSSEVNWTNDASPDFDAAQEIGGSPVLFMTVFTVQGIELSFLTPVRSFGFWIVNNNTEPWWFNPWFEVRDTNGGVIGVAAFLDEAIDGTIGIADYGFLGFAADVDIGGIQIEELFAGFDDLRFSPVPEPATLVLLAVGAMALCRRRFTPTAPPGRTRSTLPPHTAWLHASR